jgi:hypothetical protein
MKEGDLFDEEKKPEGKPAEAGGKS